MDALYRLDYRILHRCELLTFAVADALGDQGCYFFIMDARYRRASDTSCARRLAQIPYRKNYGAELTCVMAKGKRRWRDSAVLLQPVSRLRHHLR